MTIRELREFINKFDDDAIVYIETSYDIRRLSIGNLPDPNYIECGIPSFVISF